MENEVIVGQGMCPLQNIIELYICHKSSGPFWHLKLSAALSCSEAQLCTWQICFGTLASFTFLLDNLWLPLEEWSSMESRENHPHSLPPPQFGWRNVWLWIVLDCLQLFLTLDHVYEQGQHHQEFKVNIWCRLQWFQTLHQFRFRWLVQDGSQVWFPCMK